MMNNPKNSVLFIYTVSVADCHGIRSIEPEKFDLVQAEYTRRESLEVHDSDSTPYSISSLVGPTVRHSNSKITNRLAVQCIVDEQEKI